MYENMTYYQDIGKGLKWTEARRVFTRKTNQDAPSHIAPVTRLPDDVKALVYIS